MVDTAGAILMIYAGYAHLVQRIKLSALPIKCMAIISRVTRVELMGDRLAPLSNGRQKSGH